LLDLVHNLVRRNHDLEGPSSLLVRFKRNFDSICFLTVAHLAAIEKVVIHLEPFVIAIIDVVENPLKKVSLVENGPKYKCPCGRRIQNPPEQQVAIIKGGLCVVQSHGRGAGRSGTGICPPLVAFGTLAKGKALKPIPYKELDLDQPWESFDLAHELTTKGIQKFVADYQSTLRRSA
jgi:hypothetical protein